MRRFDYRCSVCGFEDDVCLTSEEDINAAQMCPQCDDLSFRQFWKIGTRIAMQKTMTMNEWKRSTSIEHQAAALLGEVDPY